MEWLTDPPRGDKAHGCERLWSRKSKGPVRNCIGCWGQKQGSSISWARAALLKWTLLCPLYPTPRTLFHSSLLSFLGPLPSLEPDGHRHRSSGAAPNISLRLCSGVRVWDTPS